MFRTNVIEINQKLLEELNENETELGPEKKLKYPEETSSINDVQMEKVIIYFGLFHVNIDQTNIALQTPFHPLILLIFSLTLS